jgi:hypothetical protein
MGDWSDRGPSLVLVPCFQRCCTVPERSRATEANFSSEWTVSFPNDLPNLSLQLARAWMTRWRSSRPARADWKKNPSHHVLWGIWRWGSVAPVARVPWPCRKARPRGGEKEKGIETGSHHGEDRTVEGLPWIHLADGSTVGPNRHWDHWSSTSLISLPTRQFSIGPQSPGTIHLVVPNLDPPGLVLRTLRGSTPHSCRQRGEGRE